MTESLSARLREMTPSLYSLEDAIASKAQELVTMATTVQGRYEQLTMLRESLEVCMYGGRVLGRGCECVVFWGC